MQILRMPDANTGGESSSSSGAQPSSVPQQGAKSSEAASGESKETPSSIAEAIKKKYNIDQPKAEASDSPSGEEQHAEKTVEELEQEAADAKATAEQSAEKSPVKLSDETAEQKQLRESKEKEASLKTPDEQLPFHKHPRFQQVISERNEFEKKIADYEPVVKRMTAIEDYCRTNNIPPQDYDDSLRLAALVNTKPQEAVTQLKAIVERLEVQLGSALPADLQEQVDDGRLALTHAQEISKLRLDAAKAKSSATMTQESAVQQAQRQLTSSLDSWTQSKMQTDPSFKPKVPNAEDGKYELVTDRFLALWQQKPPQSVEQAVSLAEQAYNSVHSFIERTMPKPQVRRPLSSKASKSNIDEPIDTSKPGWAKKVAQRHFATAV